MLATRSRGKLAEFARLLAPLGWELVTPESAGVPESAAEDGLEVHATFEANARAKARYFAELSGLPALADDSGLEVEALGWQPGVHSKRFAGAAGPDHEVADANNAELLRQLSDVPDAARGARYRCVLVLMPGAGNDWPAHEVVVEGSTAGRIVAVPRGAGGFGYDPLFRSDDLGVTFGEASAADKARVSHRGRAVNRLIEVLL